MNVTVKYRQCFNRVTSLHFAYLSSKNFVIKRFPSHYLCPRSFFNDLEDKDNWKFDLWFFLSFGVILNFRPTVVNRSKPRLCLSVESGWWTPDTQKDFLPTPELSRLPYYPHRSQVHPTRRHCVSGSSITELCYPSIKNESHGKTTTLVVLSSSVR